MTKKTLAILLILMQATPIVLADNKSTDLLKAYQSVIDTEWQVDLAEGYCLVLKIGEDKITEIIKRAGKNDEIKVKYYSVGIENGKTIINTGSSRYRIDVDAVYGMNGTPFVKIIKSAQVTRVKSEQNALEGGGLIYFINEDNVSVKVKAQNKDLRGSLEIPSAVTCDGKTYSVTAIDSYAFKGCEGLTKVTIPNSVRVIDEEAFYGCTGLISVTIPKSVTKIGRDAFYNTIWYYNQPNGLVYAGMVAYKYKETITNNGTSVVLKNECVGIADYAFSDCSGLTEVTIPNSVTEIGKAAFYGCTGLTSLTIPNSVTEIGMAAFSGCTSLTEVTIPNSVTSIGEAVFYGCSGLTSLVVEYGNTIFDSRNNCNAIIETKANTLIAGCKNTIIPNSVTEIGVCAFSGCSGLTKVTIPNSVTKIGGWAFRDCSGLTEVTIPNSVTGIGQGTFFCCESLTKVTLPNSATEIGDQAFVCCKGLTQVTIPNLVTKIGFSAFSGCKGLREVTIPDSVTRIGGWAFYSCTSLTQATIPNSVTEIGLSAFSRCYCLTEVTVPEWLANDSEKMESVFYNCNNLSKINISKH